MNDLNVKELEILFVDVLKQYSGLDLWHIIGFIPEDKLRSTRNEIIKSRATELAKALANLIKREEVIISGLTRNGHITLTLPTN